MIPRVRIATFNAASVRARLPLLIEWMAEHEPDVLAIQETKVEDAKFPMAEFEELGYQVQIHGQKAWNGVATLTRSPSQVIAKGFEDDLMPVDARLLAIEVDGISIINTYVPNGSSVGSEKFEYKLRWLERFRRFLDERFRPAEPLIWLGDINVAPTPLDVYDSKKFHGGVGHNPEEFVRLSHILEFGLTDLFRTLHPDDLGYSFFDFTVPRAVDRNLGWRIDHIYVTEPLVPLLQSVTVDLDARRAERPSDHTFVVAQLDL
ncbi:exodeoxyribonuclease III [bacterium]|nr:MAG: exodeoxyribonuclease III [bacterium]